MPQSRRRAPIITALVVGRAGGSSTEVLDEIRRAILDGGVPPGTPIPVTEVAAAFGVSPTPVREALKILQGESLVQHSPRGEYTVARVSAAELREFYVVRHSLECAAMLAAVVVATDADRAAARAAYDALDRALQSGDSIAYHKLSRAFHLTLVKPSRMTRLLDILERAWNVTEPVQPMVHITDEQRRELHSDHACMLDAFIRGDGDGLITLARSHDERLDKAITTIPSDLGLLAK